MREQDTDSQLFETHLAHNLTMHPLEETTAEFSRDELIAARPLTVRTKVTVACKTDLGRVRENNEDKFEYYIPEDELRLAARGMVFMVCDGMGGHAAGQIASEMTCKTFIDVYYSHQSESQEEAARAAVFAANRYVLDSGRAIPDRRGMGTTLSTLILCEGAAFTVQVGDSRIYRLRDAAIKQITDDHTFVEEQVRAGVLTREQAESHPYAHVLTRAVGVEEGVVPDVVKHELLVGDIYLLCSDGLTGHVSDEEIFSMLSSLSPSEAAWRLVGAALQGGGRDNCTVLIVRVDSIDPC